MKNIREEFQSDSFQRFEKLDDLKKQEHGFSMILCDDKKQKTNMTITCYENGIIRITINRNDNNKSSFIDETMLIPQKINVIKKPDGYKITWRDGHMIIKTDPWEMFLNDEAGTTLFHTLTEVDARKEFNALPCGWYQKKNGDRQIRINWEFKPDISYFGLGEKFGKLDKKGQNVFCWNENPYGAGKEKSYKNSPFLQTNGGYAILLNESAPSLWDIGKRSNFSNSIRIDNDALDLFIFLGDIKKNLKTYANLTGKAPLPPLWSFGTWISPFGNYLTSGDQNKLVMLEVQLQKIDKNDIPCDVFHLDPFWMGEIAPICSFEWGEDVFTNPQKFIDSLHQRGIKLCLWEHPYLKKDSPLYTEGKDKGYLIKREDGSVYDYHIVCIPGERRKQKEYAELDYDLGGVVDFLNPDACEWYKSIHRKLIDMGVDTFKPDFGEAIPYDGYFYGGVTGRKAHNLYSLLYNKTVYEVLGETQEQPIVWGRSGYIGSQKYPVSWSGDPKSLMMALSATIRGGLSFGLSGFPFWSFDIGGFKGVPNEITFIRWAQVGLLISHSRFHGTTSRMPWDFGDRALSIVRNFIKLRYSLLPYLYVTSGQVVDDHLPVIRALPLAFPKDPAAYSIDHQFMLGDSLLIAPPLGEDGHISVYIPKGHWFDFWTDEQITGPCIIEQTVPLEIIPIFVRSGSIIPRIKPVNRVPERWGDLEIHCYGESNQSTVKIPASDQQKEVIIEWIGEKVIVSGDCNHWTTQWHVGGFINV